MAKQTLPEISLSDKAPAEPIGFTFANAPVFELSGKKTFATDDPAVIAAAELNDWLTVKYPPGVAVRGAYREQVAPEDDPFTSLGSPVNPNDPEQAQAAEDAKIPDIKVVTDDSPPEADAPTIITLAADPTSKTSTAKDKN